GHCRSPAGSGQPRRPQHVAHQAGVFFAATFFAAAFLVAVFLVAVFFAGAFLAAAFFTAVFFAAVFFTAAVFLPKRPPFFTGAAASSSRHCASVSSLGSWSLGMRAFFSPSVM